MYNLNRMIDEAVESGTVTHIAVRVGMGDRILYDAFRGDVHEKTLFDMASVTKIMVTTTLALIALDRGLLSLEDPVNRFYPTSKPLTVRHLLTHTMGIGYKNLRQDGNTYANIAEKILEIPSDIEIGSDVRYSCPGYILLGKLLEKIFGMPLNEAFEQLVAKPLGLFDSSFLPQRRQDAVNANTDEAMRGIVNDNNCRFLGGVAGNAGLFSNLADVTKYVGFLQSRGAPLLRAETFSGAIQNQTAGMSQSRGLGFLYVDQRYTQTGKLFASGSIGHGGHTGQSIFADLQSGLYVIILSDATVSTVRKYGEEHYDEVTRLRECLHSAIKSDLPRLDARKSQAKAQK